MPHLGRSREGRAASTPLPAALGGGSLQHIEAMLKDIVTNSASSSSTRADTGMNTPAEDEEHAENAASQEVMSLNSLKINRVHRFPFSEHVYGVLTLFHHIFQNIVCFPDFQEIAVSEQTISENTLFRKIRSGKTEFLNHVST